MRLWRERRRERVVFMPRLYRVRTTGYGGMRMHPEPRDAVIPAQAGIHVGGPRENGLFAASCGSPRRGPSASPMFAPASCLRSPTCAGMTTVVSTRALGQPLMDRRRHFTLRAAGHVDADVSALERELGVILGADVFAQRA